MALDATIGGATANSYQDRTEAGLYFADHLYAADWGADTARQDKALIMACRRLEQEEYVGQRATTTQALSWPRANTDDITSDFELEDLYGNGHDSATIPRDIKYAHCEVALAYLVSDISGSGSSLSAAGLKALDLGPIKLDFGSGESILTGDLPTAALQYLKRFRVVTLHFVRA